MKELVRYIHLNPLRAGIVEDFEKLASYPYSGHSVLMGKKKKEWQDDKYVLRFFGEQEREARGRYLSFVSEGVGEGRRPELVGGGLLRSVGGWKGLKDLRESGEKARSDERILGGSEFVERVLRESEEEWEKRFRVGQRGTDLEGLLAKVADHFGVGVEDLRSRSKIPNVAKARAVFCYLGVREVGFTAASIAKELDVSPSTVSKAIVRAPQFFESEDIDAIL